MREQTVVQALRDDRPPRQRAGRRRAEHLALRRSRTTRSWCSCRASPTSRARRTSSASTALLELKLVEAGPAPTQEALLQAHGGQVPAGHGSRLRRGRRDGGGTVVLPGAQDRGGHRQRSARRAADDRREQPPGGPLLADQRRRAQVRQGHRREHRPLARDHPRQPGACRRRASKGGSPTRGGSPAASPREEVNDLSLVLRSGALPASMSYLEERVDRPDPRRRLDPRRRARVARRAWCFVVVFMLSTTSCRASTRSSRWSST